MDWTPEHWKTRPALQQPAYPDPLAVDRAVAELATLPPLVTAWEIEALREQIAAAQAGERFVLHGGDCAERFGDCTAPAVENRLKVLLQMSLVLVHGLSQRVVRIGRFAGQYAKPRSIDTETRDGKTLPSYRGDLVNDPAFEAAARAPDPQRMLDGYGRAALTLNHVRALSAGGFADLHHPENWDLGFMTRSPALEAYREVVADIGQSLRFMESILGIHSADLRRVDFYTSHEALLLPYEQALTQRDPHVNRWYNTGTHFPWIGVRTADPDGAHVELLRGIANPIGVKVGPQTTPEILERLLDRLDPGNLPGRITLIHRFGHDRVEAALPPLVRAVQARGVRVLWVCDPMHGNTVSTAQGIKTRRFDHILAELTRAAQVHRGLGSRLGGVHFELTADDVTECVGGAGGLQDADLHRAYVSEVDPRLNYAQAMEMAFRLVEILR